MTTSVLWLRRDLRVRDHPAFRDAADAADEVLALFVLDPALWRSAGPVRRAWLAANLRALDDRLGGRLVLRHGDPRSVVPEVARSHGATSVHVSAETTPYGRRRDDAVASALAGAGIAWQPSGSPYAVGPGRVVNGSGKPYRVFTPFRRAWREHGWSAPAPTVRDPRLVSARDDTAATKALDTARPFDGMPTPGEDAAWRRWRAFRDRVLDGYHDSRDLPAVDGTSRLSPYLKLGVLHPRSLLAALGPDLAAGPGAETFASELAWREFYADVLWHHPTSAWADLTPALDGMGHDEPADAIEAWRTGTTGFPIVDAGMRQLLAEGWMHNRVRMITASFLTKDLHVWWPVGARHFLDHLVDGDLASNNHGWQWVAGTGTDASPYFRVFNPVTQGQRFDPDGAYVRRWVPELAHLPGKVAHTPWDHEDGYVHGYPARIVDHAEERAEALRRYRAR